MDDDMMVPCPRALPDDVADTPTDADDTVVCDASAVAYDNGGASVDW